MHEVKIISCSKTRYKPNSAKRAVDARADLLPQEYLTKAKEADRKYNLTPEGTVGPVERKLAELGEVQGVVSVGEREDERRKRRDEEERRRQAEPQARLQAFTQGQEQSNPA